MYIAMSGYDTGWYTPSTPTVPLAPAPMGPGLHFCTSPELNELMPCQLALPLPDPAGLETR